jgi:hypothetical protein
MSYPMARADKEFVKNFIIKTIDDLNAPENNRNKNFRSESRPLKHSFQRYDRNNRSNSFDRTIRPKAVKWSDMPFMPPVFNNSNILVEPAKTQPAACEIINCWACDIKKACNKPPQTQVADFTPPKWSGKSYLNSQDKIINVSSAKNTIKNYFAPESPSQKPSGQSSWNTENDDESVGYLPYSEFNKAHLDFMKFLRDDLKVNPMIFSFVSQYISYKLKQRCADSAESQKPQNEVLIEKLMTTISSNLSIIKRMYGLIGMINRLDPKDIQLLHSAN